jgi:hypothetical protein
MDSRQIVESYPILRSNLIKNKATRGGGFDSGFELASPWFEVGSSSGGIDTSSTFFYDAIVCMQLNIKCASAIQKRNMPSSQSYSRKV